MAKSFKVKQIRSTIGKTKKQIETIRCIGLRGINSEVVVKDDPAMRGMIFKVQHMLEVTPVSGKGE